MGFIPENQINELKDRLDIVEVISRYVELKRAGSSYKGLCPFHNEKTPSFMVSREKNNFHCFGCHEGGDAISFIMKIENIGYIEAVKFLAEQIGMVLEEESYNKEYTEKYKRYYEINSLAGRFYLKNMLTESIPQNYLKNRNIKLSVLNSFFLGYAKSDNGLYKFLKEKNISEEDMMELGLIGKSQNGDYYDKFRDRIMFPILNNQNRLIGFGARTIIDHKIKYLNSPESEIFIKGKNIYGINIVNKTRNRAQILLVEGYMDVIGLYNYGIDYAVATLGTALTEDQAKLVKRYSNNIYIAYDGDEAGIKATLRAIDIFKNMNVQLGVLSFPDKMDPDEYIRKFGKEKFEILIKNAKDPIEYKLEKLSEKNLSKIDFVKEIIEFLSSIEGNVIRDIYIDKSARFIGVSTDSLRRDVSALIESNRRKESFKEKTNFNNQSLGYKNISNNLESKNDDKIKRNRLQLEKEIIVFSLLSKEYYLQLKKYKTFIKTNDLIYIYDKIDRLYNENTNELDILESDSFKNQNLNQIYYNAKKSSDNLKLILVELESRIERALLEDKREYLLNLISSGDTDAKLIEEYSEIMQKLT